MAYESLLETIQRNNNELFFGIVSAGGTPVNFCLTNLKEELSKHGYETHALRLSEYPVLLQVPTAPPDPGVGEYKRINALMQMGNAARAIALDRYAWPRLPRRLEELYLSLVNGDLRRFKGPRSQGAQAEAVRSLGAA